MSSKPCPPDVCRDSCSRRGIRWSAPFGEDVSVDFIKVYRPGPGNGSWPASNKNGSRASGYIKLERGEIPVLRDKGIPVQAIVLGEPGGNVNPVQGSVSLVPINGVRPPLRVPPLKRLPPGVPQGVRKPRNPGRTAVDYILDIIGGGRNPR